MEITAEERQAASELPVEYVRDVALGLTRDWDEAIDGCTVYEPDGTCPHGRPGLAQVAVLTGVA